MVETGGLENRFSRKRDGGSNPPLTGSSTGKMREVPPAEAKMPQMSISMMTPPHFSLSRKAASIAFLFLSALLLGGVSEGTAKKKAEQEKKQDKEKKKKPPDIHDILGFVHKYYNCGMQLSLGEEEEVRMSVSVGNGAPQLRASQGLLKLTQEDPSMLGFAMAHQLGHVYSYNRKILRKDPDWRREKWDKAAREEEYRADRFAMTLMSFSPDFTTVGAKQFLMACSQDLGEKGNFCHSLPGLFPGQEISVRAPFTDRTEFVLESGRWISGNFPQVHAGYWSQGIDRVGRRKLIRDFHSIIPSMICWPHC